MQQPLVSLTNATVGAAIDRLDFKHQPDQGRAAINDWVAQSTEKRIQDLMPPGSVDDATRLVITNAIYFLGKWQSSFASEATSPQPFHLTSASSHAVPTMHARIHDVRYGVTDGVKLLDLPFKGGALAMMLVLPDEVEGLGAVEGRLSEAKLTAWIGAMRGGAEVQVSLPRFEINPAESLELGSALKELGMPRAFDRKTADLTGLATPGPDENLYISEVLHKAMVKVDEAGTEAAAATAVVVAVAPSVAPSSPFTFNVDHPFLFFLRHVDSGIVLFMGRVRDPSAR